MVNVSLWQALNETPEVSPEANPNNALPGLAAKLDAETWVENPVGETRKNFDWRLRGMNKNGYLDFTEVSPAKPGEVGYAVTYIYSTVPRDATFSLSSDYWLVFKVNGRACVDQSKEGRTRRAPSAGEIVIQVPLRKGWNRLEMKVGSGSAGFGFWCQVSDPGDLRIAPSATVPEMIPAESPAPEKLLAEPLESNLLYAEPMLAEDDPYGFNPW
jgi:beta-galactosidase